MHGPRWLILLVAISSVATVIAWYGLSSAGSYAGDRIAPTTITLPLDGPPLFPFRLVHAFPHHAFQAPIDIRQPARDPRKRIFILEHTGQIYSFQNNVQDESKTLILDLSQQVCPKGGALGLAFHPDFGRVEPRGRNYFFVFYVFRRGETLFDRLSRFELLPGQDVVDPESEVVLIDQEDAHVFHNGGCLRFGPDGFLYVSVGDEGGANDEFQSSQQIDRGLFSGILRIDVDCLGGERSHPIRRQPKKGRTAHYYIPSDNPFAGQPDALEEFWAIGLRSPHRFSFDRTTGEMWCADTGQSRREEINRIEKGGNYQWCYREGTRKNADGWLKERPAHSPGVERGPSFEYRHEDGNGCIIGAHVYQSDRLPQLKGKYVFGDSRSGRIWAIDLSDELPIHRREFIAQVPADLELISFGEDTDGGLYVCARPRREFTPNRPGIYRLQANDPSTDVSLPGRLSETGIFRDLSTLQPHPGIIPYSVNVSIWSDGAVKRRWMSIPGNGRANDPKQDRIVFREWEPWKFPIGSLFVKHFEMPVDGTDPSILRRLETRVLVRDRKGGVYGVTYKWLDDGSDAVLLEDECVETLSIKTKSGERRKTTWRYPSRRDCLACHNAMAGYVLGVQTAQMNCQQVTFDGRTVDQIKYLNDAGYLTCSPSDREKVSDEKLAALPRFARHDDPQADLEARARSYLAVECSYCHQNFWYLDLRYTTSKEFFPIDSELRDDLGVIGARSIKPGLPEKSLIFLRVNCKDPAYKMPPIGRETIDPSAVRLLEKWIRAMPGT